jgi:hypothetical protein
MLFSMTLQDGPAQTTNYMLIGYTVIFGSMLIYVISLYLRQRNLERDLELMKELEKDKQ